MIRRECVQRASRRALSLVCLLFAGAAPLRAQILSGTVADSASRRPISGVVVSLLDSSGAAMGRTLTDTGGTFRLTLTPAARRVRAQRIGFRPLEIALPRDPNLISLLLARIPTLLEARRVVADACGPVRADGAGTVTLVEQARAGLLAMSVAREEHPAEVAVLTYERSLDGPATVTSAMLVNEMRNSRTGSSFGAAATASEFITRGFRGGGPDAGTFFAPDADVLLDDAFSATYCFRRVRAGAGRAHQVGLGFAVARPRRGRVDVDGTLWIDTLARELREIEFRYVGLPGAEERFRPGGEIHFRTMGNGLVFVDRWSLLLVSTALDTVPGTLTRGEALVSPRYFRHATGGELARATWPDGTEWRGALGTTELTARRQDGGLVADVVLELDRTPFIARTGADGRVRLSGLPPGPYTVVARDTALEAVRLKIPTFRRFTSARDSTRWDVEVPTLAEFVATQCALARRAPLATDTVVVLARIFTSTGVPRPDVRYAIKRASTRGVTSAQMQVLTENAQTRADGIIPQCRGLRIGDEIELELKDDAGPPMRMRVTLHAAVTVLPILMP